jgi:hypothetical protein
MRGIVRFLIDVAMIVAAYEVSLTATGSVMWAWAGAIIITAYGAWCFADGGVGKD